MSKEKIILWQRQSPGDYLCCLAALESLHIQFPNRFVSDLHCIYPQLFHHHPHVTRMRKEDGRVIEMQCPSIHISHRPNVHFLSTWCDFLGDQLGLPLKLQVAHPTIYLSETEKALPRRKGSWVINAGRKEDCEAKHWGRKNYQAVVDMTPEIHWIQIGESFHQHKPLDGVENLVGTMNGDCRKLIRLVSQCDGTLSGVTFLAHVAAALKKPSVVVNLREPKHFTTSPRSTMLSTHGLLPCSTPNACWASACSPKGHGNKCQRPVFDSEMLEWLPGCHDLITPQMVVDAVRSYRRFSLPALASAPSARPAVAEAGLRSPNESPCRHSFRNRQKPSFPRR